MPAAPSPSPSSTTDPAGVILHSLWRAATTIASQNSWIVVVLGLLVVTALVRSARVAIHDGPRDPIRTFTRQDKAVLLARAGDRCEHHSRIGGRRCPATQKLEADHVHPWSRGGSTHLSNGQILCKAHNQAKKAGIPWNRTLLRMAGNRAAYYPTEVDPAIVRKARPVVSK